MIRLTLPPLTIAVLAGLLAAPAPAAAAAPGGSCSRTAPAKLRFDRTSGKTHGTLRWSVHPSARRTVYRVWRGKRVVGQTTARRIRVNVRIGRAYAFRVSAVRDGRATRCSALRRVKVAYRAASVPTHLAVVDKGEARLTWQASRRGDARIAGYRVMRDGAVVKQTKSTKLTAPMGGQPSYTFAVATVDVKGKVSPPSPSVTVKRDHRAPPAPTGLAAEGATENSVSLAWLASQKRGSSIKAYRVTRDGTTVGQVAATRHTVTGLRRNVQYGFSVRAVDSLGYVSLAAPELRVRAENHQAPQMPAGLTANALSDSEVTLAWQPSAASNGRVVGYRVARDGLPVGQHPGPALRLGNLAGATTYTFTVQAADNHGFLSTAAQVAVRTHEPVPTDGHAFAFLLASTDQSFRDFRAHYRSIGTISPTYYDCSTAGALLGRDDPLITGWARARRVNVLARFNCQRGAVISRILNEPQLRGEWLDSIIQRVAEAGYDGATLDFEAGYASDRNAYTAFTAELAARLHAQGKKLMMAMSAKHTDVLDHPRSSFFDYIELSKHVDTMFVMGWGIHWATSAPGAQDDLTWVRRVVDYVATMPDPRRFVLGMQLYAMDWPNGGGTANPADSYEYADLQSLLSATGASPVYDPAQDAMHASYTNASNVPRDVWYTDAATQAQRIELARSRGLGGVGFWRLGQEDPRLWEHPALQPGAGW